jgi:Bacterial Ig-like domain (group 3)
VTAAGGPATGVSGAGNTTARADVTATASSVAVGTVTQLVLASKRVVTGQPVTLRATVAPIPDGGTVRFLADGHAIPGCAAVPANPSTGTALCATRLPRAGQITIDAVYSGDQTFAASQSTSAVELVTWSVTLTGSPTGSGGVAATTLSCAVASGGCPVTVALIEAAPAFGPVGPSSSAARLVGETTMTIPPDRTSRVTVSLNRLGRQLLAQRTRLAVKETISLTTAGVGAGVATRTLTILP